MTDAMHIAPMSSHPAFKWGVGVWFALLLGLGLFVMPSAVHQLLAERLGIDGLLTGTAVQRAVLSGVAALLGLLIGLVLAMRVAAINDAAGDDDVEAEGGIDEVWLHEEQEENLPAAASENGPRRPFNPREDMDEEGIATIPLGASLDPALDESPAQEPDDAVEPEDAFFEEIEVGEIAAAQDDTDMEPTSDNEVGLAETRDAPLIERFEEAETPVFAPQAPTEALGDMSLDALTARLGAALDAFKAASLVQSDNSDPVIAFLRREAERDAPPHGHKNADDPQIELRSALEKLNRVGKPK